MERRKEFRSMGARMNYLGLDRSDIQYAVKEVCQDMSKPSIGGRAKIKRVVRYIVEQKGWFGSTRNRTATMR